MYRCLALCFCVLFHVYNVRAQSSNATVKGTVQDEAGKPVSGAIVQLKQIKKQTQTSNDGSFALNAPAGKYTLSVESMNAEPQEMNVEMHSGETVELPVLHTTAKYKELEPTVCTGQFEPQSLRRSVYNVRVISSQRIKAQASNDLTGILNKELGFRFTYDGATGTSDVVLMGLSGRTVKILLDGAPMTDRGDTRESLNQIDVNTIERIEIVEGPMSVSYGSDALAGVVNIITKKTTSHRWDVNAKVQEETVGKEYEPFTGKGAHFQNVGAAWQYNGWAISGGITHNDNGGWQGNDTGRVKQWKPKEQLLGNIKLGYANDHFNIWYRLNTLDETILSEGRNNAGKAQDQKYITDRYMHQMQTEWRASDKLTINGILSYTDYKRRTQTTDVDLATGYRTLSIDGEGLQDVAKFNTLVVKPVAQYKFNNIVSLQAGLDLTMDNASGQRIKGSPSINDYAFFASSEIKLFEKLYVRPGVRLIKNSVYNAPPAILSLNVKWNLSKNVDVRAAYANGFRSPALRELYFNFIDANHAIIGNPNLKAETSNSFDASVNWQPVTKGAFKIRTGIRGYYNNFNNLINYGIDPSNTTVTTLINIDKNKTVGILQENSISWKKLSGSVGIGYLGSYNQIYSDSAGKANSLPEFMWTPEVNANLLYSFNKIKMTVGVFYKFTGKRNVYTSTQNGIMLGTTSPYHLLDVTLTKTVGKYISLNGGVKNVANITDVQNTIATASAGAPHATSGPVQLGCGRSYFLGMGFQIFRN